MSEFASEVSERVQETRQSLAEAQATGDDYLVGVHAGALESLARLAAEHDLEVPGLDEDVARLTAADEDDVVELPGTGATRPDVSV